MRPMSEGPTRALHDRLLATLAASPKRDVAHFLPAARPFDVDSFERRILGAERRLVRVGVASGQSAAIPDSGQLVLLSCRNIDSCLVALATLWKRGFVPILADADLSRDELTQIVRAFRPGYCLLDRRADPEGWDTESAGDSLAGLHACFPARRAPGGPPPPSGTAVLRLTSGSTRRPRGVLGTAEQLLAGARGRARARGDRPHDTPISPLSLTSPHRVTHRPVLLVLQGGR